MKFLLQIAGLCLLLAVPCLCPVMHGHTNGVGLVSDDNGDGSYDVTIIYGTYHSGAGAEGALSLYSEAGVELFGQGGATQNQTFPFLAYPDIGQSDGLTNAEVEAAGFTRGVDFFGIVSSPSFGFSDDLEAPLYTLAGNDDIVSLQQVTVANVVPGTYFADYDEDPVGATAKSALSQNWDSSGIDAASGGEGFRFTLAPGGGFSFPVLNSPPVFTDAGGTLAFTENQGATAIDSDLALADDNDTHFESAMVTITGGFQATEDVLGFIDQNGITHAWDAGGGILTLTGSATLADYEAALESVTYNNTSESPDTGARTVSWAVHDGDAESVAVTSTITVTSVNDAPGGSDNTVAILEDASHTFAIGEFGFTDIDGNGFASVVINTLPGAGSLELSNIAVTASQEIAVGSIGNLVFTPVSNANGSPYASFTFSVKDDGGTTDGGVDTDPAPNTMTINVSPVNDAPTSSDNTVVTNEDTVYLFVLGDFPFSDVDAGDTLNQVRLQPVTAGTLWVDADGNGILDGGETAVANNEVVAVADIPKLTFSPVADANGTGYATFQFEVHDGTDYSALLYTMTIDVTAVNDLPTSADHTVTTNEDTSYAFETGEFAFSDVEGSALNQVRLQAVTAGTLWVDVDSSGILDNGEIAVANNDVVAVADIPKLTFAPVADANGTGYATFLFEVHDGTDYSASLYTMTIDVTPVNDAPGGAENTLTVLEDGSHSFTQADYGFSDPDGNVFFSVVINTLPAAGSLVLSSTPVAAGQEIPVGSLGDLVYTPVADANGAGYASFTFSVKDDGGTSDGGVDTDPTPNTISINVTSVNDAPEGTDNTVVLLEDGSHNFAFGDFGFSDPDGGSFTSVFINTLPASGSLALSSTPVTTGQEIPVGSIGNLAYTPVADANGAGYASFTFSVKDDGGTANGGADTDPTPNTISINVTSVNEAPSGTDNTVTIVEDGSHTFAAGDFGFSDPDGGSFTSVFINTLPASGSLALSSTPVTAGQEIPIGSIGNLVYTPVADANGAGYASFTFSVKDDGGTANGGVDTDPTPNTLTLDVTSVNDAPAGTDNTVVLLEDGLHTFAAGDFGFSDPDGGSFTSVFVNSLPAAGSLTLSSTPVTAGQEIPVGSIGNLVFTPVADANGAGYASFTFSVKDDGGTANGGVDTDPTPNTLTLDVTSVNDAPAGTDNTVVLLEDGSHTFAVGDFGFSDPDGGSFTSVFINTLPAAGSLALSSTPVTAGQEIPVGSIGNLVFTPVADANGAGYASFTFSVKDDGGTANGGVDTDPAPNTLTLDVTPVNDAPGGTDNTVVLLEDGSHNFAFGDFGFSDPDGGSFTSVFINTLPASGSLALSGTPVTAGQEIPVGSIGNLAYSPVADANGAGYASFTFSVKDDGGTSNGGSDTDPTPNTISINVTSVNDAPEGTDNTVTILEDGSHTFAVGDFGFSDPDGGSFTSVFINTLPASGSLALSSTPVTAGQEIPVGSIGNLAYTPAAYANGAGFASFAFSVKDDGGTANGGADTDPAPNTLTLDVTSVNDVPGGTDNTVTILEDGSHTFSTGEFGFIDPDGNNFASVILNTLPVAGNMELSNVAVTAGQEVAVESLGNLVFTPAANANGANYANFSFSVKDDGGTSNGGSNTDPVPNTLVLDVTPVNDPPVLAPIGPQSTNEDTPFNIPLSATDIDGDDLVFTAVGSEHIDASVNGTVLTLTPAADWFGVENITVTVSDGNGGADSETFPVTVIPVNDAPFLATQDPQFMDEDTVHTITLTATDKEAGAITYSATSDAPEVALVVSGSQLTFTPDENWFGTANITVAATDPEKDTDSQTFLLTVRPVNDLPTIQDPGPQEFDEGNIHSIPLSAFDVETANPTLSATASKPGLVPTIVGTTLQLIAVEWSGQATVTATATDEEGASASVTFPVTVNPYIAPPPFRPVHTYTDEQLIDTAMPFIFSVATGNPIQVDDPDSTHLTTTLEVRYGILKLHQATGLEFREGTSDSSSKITIYGSLGDINAALDGMTYCSTFGFVGGDTIRLRSIDQGGLTDNDFLRLIVQVVALAGQPNLTVDTIVQPGKTVQQAEAASFDQEFLRAVEVIGDGEDIELVLDPVLKQDGELPEHTSVDLLLQYTDGTSETVAVPVVIYYPRISLVQPIEGIAQLNRTTHLYEAIAEVENTTPYALEAFRVRVVGLNGGAEFRTVSGVDDDGSPYFQDNLPLIPGETRQFTLEFYVPGRRWDNPSTPLQVQLLGEPDPTSITGATARLGEDVQLGTDQSIYIGFPTDAGTSYYIQYSNSPAGPWSTSSISVVGNGLYQVWVDSGPPKTAAHPSSVSTRFYRILVPEP